MIALIIAFLCFGLVAYLFTLFIIKADKGAKEPTGALFGAVGFGVLAVLLAGELNNAFIPKEVLDQIGSNSPGGVPLGTLLVSALTVGLIEESLKAIPLALFIYKKKYFNELTDGIIYFGIVGMAFGIIEDVMYTLQYGGEVGIMRILLGPFLHAGFCALFGMYFVQKKLLNKSWLIVLFGYGAAIFAHGLYDFAAFTQGPLSILTLLAITISVNSLLFIFFRKAQRIDEEHGMSTVGTNKFCRQCGAPNPERYLFCVHCGKHS